jgi:hypothetical protein
MILIALVLMIASLMACKREITNKPQENSTISDEHGTDQPGSEENTTTAEQLFQINCYGNDEIDLHITNDEVSKLLDNTGTENNQYILIVFFAGNEQKLSLNMYDFGWNMSSTDYGTGDTASEFHIDGQADTYQRSGNSVSIKVNQIGITELLEACDNYSVMLFDSTKEDHELLAGGELSEVLTREASDKSVEIRYTGTERAILRLSGEEVTAYLNEHEGEKLCVNFYLPGSVDYMPNYVIKLGGYSANLYQYSYQKKENGSYTITPTELFGDAYNTATETENGYSALIYYEGLEALLSACEHIDVTDGQEMTFLTMDYDAAVIDIQDNIVPIPEEFLPCEQDNTYFYPVTEDYMVIKINIPKCSFYVYRIGIAPNGDSYYGPVGTYEASYNIVTLISYDEFGIADQKTKIVYDNLTDAMTASATQTDMLPADRLNGDESDDANIADFFEQLDTKVFGKALYEEPLYQYYGHFDNVRYFRADWKKINYLSLTPYFPSYDRNTQFDEKGYLTEDVNYQYIYSHIEPGLGYSESREATESITAFYSRAND